jgi:hypothetical protein
VVNLQVGKASSASHDRARSQLVKKVTFPCKCVSAFAG